MAKKLRIKLPKRVAGVKIPKSVRKGPIAGFLNSGAGQLVLAETLVAAAGTLTAAKSDPDSTVGKLVRHPVEGSKRASREAAKTSVDQGERLSFALKEASRAFRAALEAGPESENAWSDETLETRTPESVGKKKHSSRNEPAPPH